MLIEGVHDSTDVSVIFYAIDGRLTIDRDGVTVLTDEVLDFIKYFYSSLLAN